MGVRWTGGDAAEGSKEQVVAVDDVGQICWDVLHWRLSSWHVQHRKRWRVRHRDRW